MTKTIRINETGEYREMLNYDGDIIGNNGGFIDGHFTDEVDNDGYETGNLQVETVEDFEWWDDFITTVATFDEFAKENNINVIELDFDVDDCDMWMRQAKDFMSNYGENA